MKVIVEIAKYTYELTFGSNAEYKWSSIAQLFIEADKVYDELVSKALINNDESKEDVLYWQDLFFMELAEQNADMDNDEPLAQKLKAHPLFLTNQKFISKLPGVTTDLGREMLLDDMIHNENADQLIPDELIKDGLKKKSRDELRENFEEWSEEFSERKSGRVYYSLESEKKEVKPKQYSYLRYLIAACFIGAIAVLGYFNLNNGYDFDDSQFVKTTEVKMYRNNGLGFSNGQKEESITVKVFDYDKANATDNDVSDKISIHSYLFNDKELKLVLKESVAEIKLLELEKDDFYLKLNNEFYKVESSVKFQNLEQLKNQKIIQQLERLIFENE